MSKNEDGPFFQIFDFDIHSWVGVLDLGLGSGVNRMSSQPSIFSEAGLKRSVRTARSNAG